MGKTMRAIGLMSGTSMDGIDVAAIVSDGEDRLARGEALSLPYDPAFRERLAGAVAEARGLGERTARTPLLSAVEAELTERHACAVRRLLDSGGRRDADLIGFHGHTVLHAPERRLTVQLGDGKLLAALTGIDVVCDLRAADCAAGGQGAPLAPVYHRALAARLAPRPLAFLNIGGVANVTYIDAEGGLLAFDTGPGNALIDDWMRRRLGQPCDRDGAIAARGCVHEDHVAAFLGDPYFARRPPKSLDRDAFAVDALATLSDADGAATLSMMTVAAIARAAAHFPQQPALWVVSGGGRRNATLMRMLAARVAARIATAEEVGVDGGALEAEAWAYLAVRSLKGLAISFPGTTGVTQPLSGGVLCRAPPRR
jgi:anhydro-N-acetylmuramic acid kinase